jgi:uncharacterized protein YcgL (UPF0745 family)
VLAGTFCPIRRREKAGFAFWPKSTHKSYLCRLRRPLSLDLSRSGSRERRILHAACGLAAPGALIVLCYVYRSRRREGAYLNLRVRDDFSVVPDSLMQVFGTPELALELDLTPERGLASEEPVQVIANLQSRGFHLQMPPANVEPF